MSIILSVRPTLSKCLCLTVAHSCIKLFIVLIHIEYEYEFKV